MQKRLGVRQSVAEVLLEGRRHYRQATGHMVRCLRYTGCVNTRTPLVGARLIHLEILLESISPIMLSHSYMSTL